MCSVDQQVTVIWEPASNAKSQALPQTYWIRICVFLRCQVMNMHSEFWVEFLTPHGQHGCTLESAGALNILLMPRFKPLTQPSLQESTGPSMIKNIPSIIKTPTIIEPPIIDHSHTHIYKLALPPCAVLSQTGVFSNAAWQTTVCKPNPAPMCFDKQSFIGT